jgi:recombination protein RecA
MSLETLCKEFNRVAKSQIVQYGIKEFKEDVIPLSSPRANYCLYGGIPIGRLVEFFGAEGSGKTATSLDLCANAQKLFPDRKILFIDAENTYDPKWATKLGVNSDELLIMKPEAQTAEEIFQFILDAIDTGEICLVIIDSLGVMLSEQAYEKDMSERTYGGISMALTTFSKKAEMLCHKQNCTLVGINQMRDNMNSMYGGTTTTGGKAWKHNSSLRIEFKRGDFFDSSYNKVNQSYENPMGNYVQLSIVKSKCFPNDRKTGQYTLCYYTGIDALTDTVDLAIKIGVIVQSGAWFSILNPETGELIEKCQGRLNVIECLKNKEDIRNMVEKTINAYITGG